MRKRAINTRGTSIWLDENQRPKREPIEPLLQALGSVVYAVRTKDGLIKIGCTTDLARRARQVGYGMKSILAWRVGTVEDEAAIHASLNGLAARGHEWYPWDERVLAVVNEMRGELGIPPVAA